MEPAERIRAWLKSAAAEKGWSYAEWANRAGIAPSTIQRAVKDDYQFVTSSRTIAKLADAAGIDPPRLDSLTVSQGERVPAKTLAVRYEVGAGIWRSVDDVHQPREEPDVLVQEHPAYRGFDQWLERVLTDSMDKEYPIGTLLHVVDRISLGYAPQTGDHVIIERRQDGGLRERTVKEVVRTPKGIQLWARSTNPHWDGPLTIHNGQDPEHFEVEIVGLVLGSYRARRR